MLLRHSAGVNALALDLECYLKDQPVQACPPSALYRLHKFTRRNKAALLTGSVVALSVLGHRLIVRPEAEVEGKTVKEIVREILAAVPVLNAAHRAP